MNHHLADYINEQKRKGFAKDEIVDRLKRSGYSKETINQHFKTSRPIKSNKPDFIAKFFKNVNIFQEFKENKPLDAILVLFIVCFLFSIITYNNDFFVLKTLFHYLSYVLAAILIGSIFLQHFFKTFNKEHDSTAFAITVNVIFGIVFLILLAIFDYSWISLLIGFIIYIILTKFIYTIKWRLTFESSILTYIVIVISTFVVLVVMAFFAALIKLIGGVF